MRVSSTNVEVLERLLKELRKIPEVKNIELLPNCQKGVDLYVNVIITKPWNWELSEHIADAISKVKWETLEKTGELPAIEWEITEEKEQNA